MFHQILGMMRTRARAKVEDASKTDPTLQGMTPETLKEIFSFVSDVDKGKLMKSIVAGKDVISQVLLRKIFIPAGLLHARFSLNEE